MTTAIWWIRRDLRLDDNPALQAALDRADQVVPLFIIDPFFEQSPYAGDKRIAFMLKGLRTLDKQLRAVGSRLTVARGQPADVLAHMTRTLDASVVVAQTDYSRYSHQRDEAVARVTRLHLVDGATIHPPGIVTKTDRTPYVVYSPYKRQWMQLPPVTDRDLIPAPATIPSPTVSSPSAIPDKPGLPASVSFVPGEQEALGRLAAFTEGADAPVYRYHDTRNLPGTDGTSGLSPYLRWGMISSRRAAAAAFRAIASADSRSKREGAVTWLSELVWREFYTSILYHHPRVLRGNFNAKYDGISWRNNRSEFDAWTRGETGYPIVDAAMRELISTGWMHNRARMISASFLVKDLLIDWRWGERFFMQHLVDGDPAANNGGWQWAAGTGTDAAPYFRIFNPTSQAKKFDSDGLYIRRWVPELAHVPGKFLAEPWTMPADIQQQAGCTIGTHYPPPLVDHAAARERTLAAYKAGM